MDRSYDPNHSKLINALCRLQGQLLNAKWQIEANHSTLRSLAERHASRKFHKLALDNADKISAALEELDRGVARADFLTRQVHNAIKQAKWLIPESLIPS